MDHPADALREGRDQVGRELGEPVECDRRGHTTRLAMISRPSVTRLPAMRQASSRQLRRSRVYKVNPATTPATPSGIRIHRYCIVTATKGAAAEPEHDDAKRE